MRFVSPQEEDHDPDRGNNFTNGFGTLEYSWWCPTDIGWRLVGYVMPRFHKLENYLVGDNAFFALKGQIQRTMECGPKDGMIMLASPIKIYNRLQNSKMYPGYVFRPPGQIHRVSLKGFQR